MQRPLDSRTQLRIALEAEAVLGLLSLVQVGQLELIHSDALRLEVRRAPLPLRRSFAEEVLAQAAVYQALSVRSETRARSFVQEGIKPLDALHLALAEEADAHFFCTCDDKLLRRAKAILDLRTRPVSPLELVEELA